MEYGLFLTLGIVHLVAVASPGPDFALVLRSSLHRPTAIGAALGISVAVIAQGTFSLTGISLLVTTLPWLFTLLKLSGAAYLGWMGWGALKATFAPSGDPHWQAGGESHGFGRGFRLGVATNLLNPKALMYFFALLASIIPTETTLLTRSLLVAEMFALTLLWFGSLAWLLSTAKAQQWLLRLQRPLNGLIAILFLGVALSILVNFVNN